MSKEKLKPLYEERGRVNEQQKAILDKAEGENRGLNADEKQNYDNLENRFGELSSRIEMLEKQEEREKKLVNNYHEQGKTKTDDEDRGNDPKVIEEKVIKAFDTYLRFGREALEAEERQLLNTMQRTFGKDQQPINQRAQSAGTATAGGYTVPRGFSGELEKSLKEFGGMMQAGRVWTTGQGNLVDWPTVDDTANKGRLLSENTDATTGSTDAVFGNKQVNAYTYTSDLIKVSNQLLQDSDFDINSLLVELLTERLGRIFNEHLTIGTGSSQPEGMIVGATAVTGVAAAATIKFDDLIDLEHAVNQAYRKMGQFMFADSTLKLLRKVKDNDGKYIWSNGDVSKGILPSVLGRSYIINDDMAAVGASAKSIAFGDFKKYIIRQVQNIVIRRLEERYGEFNQTAFVGFMRIDGKVINSGAIKVLQHAAS